MKVSIAGIYDRGTLDKERVHFRADTDINLSFFVLLDTTWMTSAEVSAGNHSAYWFPPHAIQRGQHVVVYTRHGTANTETRPDGSTFHFLFRGLPNPLYARPEACVVLMEVQLWESTQNDTKAMPPLPGLSPPSKLSTSLADAFSSGGGTTSLADLLKKRS